MDYFRREKLLVGCDQGFPFHFGNSRRDCSGENLNQSLFNAGDFFVSATNFRYSIGIQDSQNATFFVKYWTCNRCNHLSQTYLITVESLVRKNDHFPFFECGLKHGVGRFPMGCVGF